jgi:hypothetical protein
MAIRSSFRHCYSLKRGEKMDKNILHEFYYGNINPNERPTIQSPEYKQFLKIVADSEEKLLKLLNNDEKELFRTFSSAQGDLNEISVADGFIDGFCLGMRIAIEVIEKQY